MLRTPGGKAPPDSVAHKLPALDRHQGHNPLGARSRLSDLAAEQGRDRECAEAALAPAAAGVDHDGARAPGAPWLGAGTASTANEQARHRPASHGRPMARLRGRPASRASARRWPRGTCRQGRRPWGRMQATREASPRRAVAHAQAAYGSGVETDAAFDLSLAPLAEAEVLGEALREMRRRSGVRPVAPVSHAGRSR